MKNVPVAQAVERSQQGNGSEIASPTRPLVAEVVGATPAGDSAAIKAALLEMIDAFLANLEAEADLVGDKSQMDRANATFERLCKAVSVGKEVCK